MPSQWARCWTIVGGELDGFVGIDRGKHGREGFGNWIREGDPTGLGGVLHNWELLKEHGKVVAVAGANQQDRLLDFPFCPTWGQHWALSNPSFWEASMNTPGWRKCSSVVPTNYFSPCVLMLGAQHDSFGCPALSKRALGWMPADNWLDMMLKKKLLTWLANHNPCTKNLTRAGIKAGITRADISLSHCILLIISKWLLLLSLLLHCTRSVMIWFYYHTF